MIVRKKYSKILGLWKVLRHSRVPGLLLTVPFFLGLLILSPSFSEADFRSSKGSQKILNFPAIPKEFGEIIYHHRSDASKQLYIIGLEHRDSITRLNGARTAKVQAEVYKIGEWLILNEGLGLLLPEGFFSKTGKTQADKPPGAGENGSLSWDLDSLEKKLADNKTYVNAEMLLKRNYGLRTRQIEDKELYDAVHENLCKLVFPGKDPCDFDSLKAELDSLQERRLAAMLQKIPEVIGEEVRQSHIKKNRALMTIGISHMPNIIKYLSENRIPLPPRNHSTPLNLLKEDFGVVLFLPRRLAHDEEVLKITRLTGILEQSRKKSFLLPLSP